MTPRLHTSSVHHRPQAGPNTSVARPARPGDEPDGRRSRHAVRFAVAAVAVVGLSAAAACSNAAPHAAKSSTATPSASTSSSASPSASPSAVGAVNPLTGVGPVPHHPVIVVKIDDTAPGRPQVGIDKADIVYLEAAEAGLTRLAAVFASSLPTVGYIRSTRPSDPELLRQYGKITEVYSGGQSVSRNILAASGLNGYDYGAGAPGFYRVNRPESTYINVELNLAAIAKHLHTARPHSNGWTFASSLGSLPSTPGGRMDTVVTGSYSIGTAVEFRYYPALHAYVRYIDGQAQHAADGHLVTATNVVVQSCRVYSFTRDRDVNGNPAQFTVTLGSGPLAVFRGGRRIDGTWSRSTVTSGTSLRTTSGQTIPLAPGNTWVVLVRKGIGVHG